MLDVSKEIVKFKYIWLVWFMQDFNPICNSLMFFLDAVLHYLAENLEKSFK